MPNLMTSSGFVSAVFVLFATVNENAAATPISSAPTFVVPQNFAIVVRAGENGFSWVSSRTDNRSMQEVRPVGSARLETR